ncbi:sensor histidine kinase [Pseudocnuella soli]|uniref:sensor histidine kinase n=1 Tax=Pseudocnuella soli TaxID=2502779 RepID=UPI00195C9692|nr:histidine kinase [Pseudocnuella soli]
MKYRNIKLDRFSAIELWVFSAIFILMAITFMAPAFDELPQHAWAPNRGMFEAAGAPFNYYQHYLLPWLIRYIVLFAAFIALNFKLVPAIIRGERAGVHAAWAAVILLAVALVIFFTNYYLKFYLFYTMTSEKAVQNNLWQLSFLYTFRLLLLFVGYTMLRYTGLKVFGRLRESNFKSRFVNREWMIAAALWIIMAIFLAATRVMVLFQLWVIAVPCALLFYYLGFNVIIPKALRRKKPVRFYILCTFVLGFLCFLLPGLLLSAMSDDVETGMSIGLFNGFLQFLIVGPAVWILFKRQMKGNEELYALKTELGQSTASLDFLRSQINPHFLFNALNTLYGTAIQEGADRTGEGVQKLGDMMRFMLLENMQEKIALTREIEYLENYVSLQRLRTDASPSIRIQVSIPEEINPLVQIAPMLLIPFIENAFKHGISLREESYIKISLELKGSELYFDVYNSKHQRPQHDPEKTNNGIGLVNVRQRLQLLYPNRHELVVRETPNDFFVHLIVNLGK